jgi:hypothetical protein
MEGKPGIAGLKLLGGWPSSSLASVAATIMADVAPRCLPGLPAFFKAFCQLKKNPFLKMLAFEMKQKTVSNQPKFCIFLYFEINFFELYRIVQACVAICMSASASLQPCHRWQSRQVSNKPQRKSDKGERNILCGFFSIKLCTST